MSASEDTPRGATWAHAFTSARGGARSPLGLWLLGVGAYGVLLLVLELSGVVVGRLTRDTVSVVDAPVSSGIFSTAGGLTWAAAATCCLLAGSVLTSGGGSDRRLWLLTLGGFIAFVGLDDVFLLHEEVFPDQLGIPQKLVIATYGVAALVVAARFRQELKHSRLSLLVLALAGFAGSAAMDVAHGYVLPLNTVVEDSLKLVGVATLLAYCVGEAKRSIEEFRAASVLGASSAL